MKKYLISSIVLSIILSTTLSINAYSKIKDIEGHWANKEISNFIENSYVKGYKDNTFKPNKQITREETPKIIIRIKNQIDNNYDKLETFQDKHLVSNWAKPYIERAIESGYLKGDNLKELILKKI